MSGERTLVVLAAGMGSRYGGLKQLDPVGPGGATLMDYAVFDAWRTGFANVLFIIRPEMEEAFRPFVEGRYGGRVHVGTAHQRLDDLPSGFRVPDGRVKPWGTAHAVLAAAGAVRGPFAVVNADDFYGAKAYAAVTEFLGGPPAGAGPHTWAIVGYRLGDTLSAEGGVNRGVCRTTDDGWLTGIEEVVDIARRGGTLEGRAAAGTVTLQADVLVSMNIWAFTPAAFDVLREGFARFLARPNAASGEYLLPGVVQEAITAGTARVRVLDAGSRWFGMTHKADRPAVESALRALVAEGLYPERLW